MIMYSDTYIQKKSKIASHLTLIIMLSILFFNIVGSRWTALAFNIQIANNKVFIATLYLPLALFLVTKFVRDMSRKRITKFSLILYGFICYCICVVMIRLIFGDEVKYTVYWTIIIGGCISAVSLIFSYYQNNEISLETIINDFINFGIIISVFKFLWFFSFPKLFIHDPINVNQQCCIMILVLPCAVMGYILYGGRKNVIAILLFSIVILLSGSRGGVFLYVFEMALLFLLWIKRGYKIYKFLLMLVLAVFVLGGFILFNVGDIQNYLQRALVFYNSSSTSIAIIDQVSRSDALRTELFTLGYNEFLKSPLIGTGTIYFSQVIGGLVFNQSCHNFILETLDCFGLLGLGQLTLLFAITFKMIPKSNSCICFFKIISLVYFGYAMVQPLLYDPLAFLTYCTATMICISAGYCTNLQKNGKRKVI